MKNQKTLLGLGSIRFRASSGIRAAFVITAASLLAIGSLQAAPLSWDPGQVPATPTGGAGAWDTSSSFWSNGATDAAWINANNDAAIFGNTGGAVVLDAGGMTANALTFGVTGYTLSGGALTLAGTTPNISVTTAGQSATINSQIAGTAGVTISGAGMVVFSNINNGAGLDNNYSGGTTISSGATLQTGTGLKTTATGTYATLGVGAVTVSSGGTLNMWTGQSNTYTYANALALNTGTFQSLDGTYIFTGAVTLGTGTSTINAAYGGKGITLSGGVSGSGSLNLGATAGTTGYGVSNIVMSGANTYLGTTTVTGVNVTLSSIGAGAITVNNGVYTGSLIFNSATPSTTLNQTISGNGQIVQASNNTITLTGNNSSFTGSFAISGAAGGSTGTISYSTAANLGVGTSAIVIGQNGSSSGILQYTGAGDTLSRGITLSGNGALDASGSGLWNITGNLTDNSGGTHNLTLTGTGTAQYSGNINSTVKGNVTKSGAGSWTLSGANGYTGNTTINTGILATANTTALGTGAVAVSGGTLQVGDGTNNALTLASTLNISTGATLKLGAATSQITMSQAFTLGNDVKLDITGLALAPGNYTLIAGSSNTSTLGTWSQSSDLIGGNVNYTYQFGLNGTNAVLTVVPEPSTLVLAGIFGFGMLMLFRRRRA